MQPWRETAGVLIISCNVYAIRHMKIYKVNVIEYNEAQIEIEAESEGEAQEKAREMYENGEIRMDEYINDNGYVDCVIDRG
jgi:hypothetical protein